jgi:hypothetical protein
LEEEMTNFTAAFVTEATSLLGSNLVRALVSRGVRVAAPSMLPPQNPSASTQAVA